MIPITALPHATAESWTDQCAELGRMLGLAGPVPDAVLRRALADQRFAYHLLSCSGRPEMLERFFRAPATLAYAEPAQAGQSARAAGRSAGQKGQTTGLAVSQPDQAAALVAGEADQSGFDLARTATRALARWAKSGFVRADPQAYERRLAACLRCDQLAEPPRSVLAKIAAPGAGDRADGKVCGACGCFVTRKAGLASESCPLPDLADPARSRWGEPLEA